MNVEMTYLEVIGLKTDLQAVLRTLYRVGCVQIDEVRDSPTVSARPLTLDRELQQRQEELSLLAAQVEGLLGILGGGGEPGPVARGMDDFSEASQGMAELAPIVQALTSRRDELEAELGSLPRYEATLRRLLPIVPPSARDPANTSVGAVVSRAHTGVIDSVVQQVLDLTRGRGEVMATDIDASSRAMVIVFPREFVGEVEALLGREDVTRLRLPGQIGEGPPDVVLAALHKRLAAIPRELESIQGELEQLAIRWRGKLTTWREVLQDELGTQAVVSRLGETDMSFVLVGWVPRGEVERVRASLGEAVGEALSIREIALTPEIKKRAPVALRNPSVARPFESLVGLLALPRYGEIDPTRLMAVFLPVFFGMILGDIGYGAILLLMSLGLMRRVKKGVMRDVLIVLAFGSGWSILFGLLFGEAFGTLGEHLGLRAIWFERTSAESVTGLLLMALGVGAVHITLGLALGVREALRMRSRGHLLERGGMLLGLVSLFLLVGILVDLLPRGFMTPAVAGLIVGVVLMGASLGWLGVLMGPIEFIGLIGNILSYLRIAAIGLASVYLAKVANDMAGMLGSVVVGTLVAVLIHALNLVLGAFSPTIQSLRLHYVEFFRKFYEGGGRPYEPFKSRLWSGDRLSKG
jgi:V/A-type H+-transporting ATPase subunit I